MEGGREEGGGIGSTKIILGNYGRVARPSFQIVIPGDIWSQARSSSSNTGGTFANLDFSFFPVLIILIFLYGFKWRYFPRGSDNRQRPGEQEKKHIEQNAISVFL